MPIEDKSQSCQNQILSELHTNSPEPRTLMSAARRCHCQGCASRPSRRAFQNALSITLRTSLRNLRVSVSADDSTVPLAGFLTFLHAQMLTTGDQQVHRITSETAVD